MIGTNLFTAACMWLFLPITCVTMKNNLVRKNNLILSVTLPPEAVGDSEVTACCDGFRKKLRAAFWLLTAALIPAVFLPWVSVSMTWSLVWLLIAMFAIMRVYGKGYQALKALKLRRGWTIPTAGQTVAELRPMKLPKRLKTGWFVPPMVLSVLPVLSCFLDDWGEAWNGLLATTAGCNLLVTAMSLLFYGCVFRQKKDILDGDLELTEALTRVRRYNWTKMWLLTSWLSAFYSLAVWFCRGNMTWYMVWTLGYCVLLTAAALVTEFAARRAQQRLTQGRTQVPVVDEDDRWVWGQFYYDPNSTKAMVNERVGVGMSMNFAHPAGKAMAALTVLALLSLPLLGVWLMVDELMPIRWEVTEEQVLVRQVGELYAIDRDEITEVRLLDELPAASRTWGTGLPNLLKGTFTVDGHGPCTLCLDPTAPPFLLIDTVHETYILGLDGTEELYETLTQ